MLASLSPLSFLAMACDTVSFNFRSDPLPVPQGFMTTPLMLAGGSANTMVCDWKICGKQG